MDRFGEWRPIDAATDEDGEKPASKSAPAKPAKSANPAGPEANVIGVRLIGLLFGLGLAAVGAYLAITAAPATGSGLEVSGTPAYLDLRTDAPVAVATVALEVVVDVQGAVLDPGLQHLLPGSRVGDAIGAAGGYSAAVDIAAAAAQLNLAALLIDGAKVHVPARGEAVVGTPAIAREPSAVGAPDASVGGGLIDLNTATSEQLESLPGVGEVTAAKIIAAREEAPFASVDDLQTRDVLGPSTFEKVRLLVTVGP
jgi:competence protein ComEA